MAAVSIKPKASVKIFFILFNLIFYPWPSRKSFRVYFFIPVASIYSKQMPPCQKIEKESLRPLLFMVNRYLGIVNARRIVMASWHVFFFTLRKDV